MTNERIVWHERCRCQMKKKMDCQSYKLVDTQVIDSICVYGHIIVSICRLRLVITIVN